EPLCDGPVVWLRGIATRGDPSGRLLLLASVPDIDGRGLDCRAVGAAIVPSPGPLVTGRAAGLLPLAGWSAELVWLMGPRWIVAGDGLVTWLAEMAWPGMAA